MIKSLNELLEIKGIYFATQLKLQDQSDVPSKKNIYRNAIEYYFEQSASVKNHKSKFFGLVEFLSSIRYWGKDHETHLYLYSHFYVPGIYFVNQADHQVKDFVKLANLFKNENIPLWPEQGRLLNVAYVPALPQRPFNQTFLNRPTVVEVTNKVLRFPSLPGLAAIKPSSIKLIKTN